MNDTHKSIMAARKMNMNEQIKWTETGNLEIGDVIYNVHAGMWQAVTAICRNGKRMTIETETGNLFLGAYDKVRVKS